MLLLLWCQIVLLWHQVTMVASELHLYQTILLPRKLETGSIHDYLFLLLPPSGYSIWGTEHCWICGYIVVQACASCLFLSWLTWTCHVNTQCYSKHEQYFICQLICQHFNKHINTCSPQICLKSSILQCNGPSLCYEKFARKVHSNFRCKFSIGLTDSLFNC